MGIVAYRTTFNYVKQQHPSNAGHKVKAERLESFCTFRVHARYKFLNTLTMSEIRLWIKRLALCSTGVIKVRNGLITQAYRLYSLRIENTTADS